MTKEDSEVSFELRGGEVDQERVAPGAGEEVPEVTARQSKISPIVTDSIALSHSPKSPLLREYTPMAYSVSRPFVHYVRALSTQLILCTVVALQRPSHCVVTHHPLCDYVASSVPGPKLPWSQRLNQPFGLPRLKKSNGFVAPPSRRMSYGLLVRSFHHFEFAPKTLLSGYKA